MAGDDAPEAELLDLARALRAQLEQLAAAGADGLPPAPPPVHAVPDPAPGPALTLARSPAAPVRDAAVPVRAASVAVAAPLPAPAAARQVEPALEPSERDRRLLVLSEQVRGCTRCRLHESRTQTVFARGDGSSGLCFVGEGPGADEDEQGYPFVGPAGQLLDRMIVAMGFTRDEVYVCNIVKCRPPKNRKPEPDEMATCTPYLTEQLQVLSPKVIVALGATAVEGLLGATGGITRLRGTWRLYRGTIPVMPTFHPAYLLRTPAAKRQVWEDLQAVVKHMGRELPLRK